MKRILSSLLMLTMLLSLMPFALPVMASDIEPMVYYYNDFLTAEDLNDMVFGETETGNPPVIEDGAVKITKDTYDVKNSTHMFLLANDYIFDFSNETTPPELVLEMRIKTHFGTVPGFFSAWDSATYNRLHTFYVDKDGLYPGRNDKGTLYDEYQNGEWQTLTVVYGNDAANLNREVYLDGVKLGTFSGNYYAKAGGKFRLDLLPYLTANGQYIMIDYLKIYEKPASVTAELLDVNEDNIIVGFSSTPTSVSQNNFSLSGTSAIETIEKINETTYRLNLTETLAGDNTLTVSGITDTIGLSLSQTELDITLNQSAYTGNEYINYHFNDSALPDGLTQSGTYPYDISNGTLTVQPSQSNGSGYMFIDKITNSETDLPEFVLEFKNKINNQESGSYMSYDTNAYYTPMFSYGAESYHNKNYNAWSWNLTVGTVNGTIGNVTNWHTYAIKYSNKDNTRSLYIDGEYAGTSTDTAVNTWQKNGWAYFRLKLYSKNKNMTSEYDYIKAYSPADNFTATVVNKEATELNEIILDFNATAINPSVSNIRVNGNVPESVTLTDEENQKYKVVLSKELQPETEYKVSLNGVSNAIGQISYDVLSFTTRALEDGEAYYSISDGGIVKANGEEISDGAFGNAVSEIAVKANKGYKAVVKVNGVEISEGAYGAYSIDTSAGADIKVDFVLEEVPSFSTPFKFYDNVNATSYTFVRLNMALPTTDFGVIVSKDADKLDASFVDGENTFMLPATNGSNVFGEYGIAIKDTDAKVLGNTYYVRPYAVFDGTYYYNTPVTVNVAEVQ